MIDRKDAKQVSRTETSMKSTKSTANVQTAVYTGDYTAHVSCYLLSKSPLPSQQVCMRRLKPPHPFHRRRKVRVAMPRHMI